jgi:CheY-like chemotaxis protein
MSGRRAEEIHPALMAVLSNINVPGMDGLRLLSEITDRQHQVRRRHTKILTLMMLPLPLLPGRLAAVEQ